MTERTFMAADYEAHAKTLETYVEPTRLLDLNGIGNGCELAAAMLRQGAAAEARWSALKPFVNSSGRADNVLHQIRAEMARLEKERTA